MRRRFYPYTVKPWLLDLVLNTRLNDKNDKSGVVRGKFHKRALENYVYVGKKRFTTVDEDSLKFDLETFHSKISLNYQFLNLYLDRSYVSGFENYNPEQS